MYSPIIETFIVSANGSDRRDFGSTPHPGSPLAQVFPLKSMEKLRLTNVLKNSESFELYLIFYKNIVCIIIFILVLYIIKLIYF